MLYPLSYEGGGHRAYRRGGALAVGPAPAVPKRCTSSAGVGSRACRFVYLGLILDDRRGVWYPSIRGGGIHTDGLTCAELGDEFRCRAARRGSARSRRIRAGAAGEIAARSPLQLFWRRFRSDRVAMVSLGFIVLLILVAIFARPIVSLIGVTGPNTPNNDCPARSHARWTSSASRRVRARPSVRRRRARPRRARPRHLRRPGLARGRVHCHRYRGADRGDSGHRSPASSEAGSTRCCRGSMDVVLAFPVLLLAIGLASACALGKGCLGA